MLLPPILELGAAIAGTVGIANGVHGSIKIKAAGNIMKSAKTLHEENVANFETQNKTTADDMDSLCEKELEILNSLQVFSDVFERLHNKPEMKQYSYETLNIPYYYPEEIKMAPVGASVLLGGICSAVAGAAGGLAAATITAAAIGGKTALASTILGSVPLSVGIMAGGIIFNMAASSLPDKAGKTFRQIQNEQDKVNTASAYLAKLSSTVNEYKKAISSIYDVYQKQFYILSYIVNTLGKTDWNDLTSGEQLVAENTVLLVELLCNMGKFEFNPKI